MCCGVLVHVQVSSSFGILDGALVKTCITLTAVASLGETLQYFVKIEADHRGFRTPEGQIIGSWGGLAKWITGHMKSSGWCPSVVMRLAESGHATVSELYYYSHLPVPQGDRDHSSCSASSCMYLKTEPSTYRTVHTTGCCGCEELSLDVGFIGESLGREESF